MTRHLDGVQKLLDGSLQVKRAGREQRIPGDVGPIIAWLLIQNLATLLTGLVTKKKKFALVLGQWAKEKLIGGWQVKGNGV